MSEDKPKDIVIGLKAVDLRAQVQRAKAVPPDVVIGLKAQNVRGEILGARAVMPWQDTATGSRDKRVFTEEEWAHLHRQTTDDLLKRIGHGKFLIQMLHSPQIINVTPKEADRLTSNLRYQIDAIWEIIRARYPDGNIPYGGYHE